MESDRSTREGREEARRQEAARLDELASARYVAAKEELRRAREDARARRRGIASRLWPEGALCIGPIALIGYGLLATPESKYFESAPKGYFDFMKIAVCGCALYVAFLLHQRSPRFAPFSLLLLALGGLEFMGKMSREEWIPWNYATIAAFAAAAMVLVAPRRRVETELPETR